MTLVAVVLLSGCSTVPPYVRTEGTLVFYANGQDRLKGEQGHRNSVK